MKQEPQPATAPAEWKPKIKRRSFDPGWKRGLVEKALRPGASVAKLARDHDLNTNQLFRWCRQHERGLSKVPQAPALLPVVINESRDVSESVPVVGRLTVELARGSLKFDGPIDAEVLRTIVLALSGR